MTEKEFDLAFDKGILDSEYADYITSHQDSSRPIYDGDMLIEAMEDGYLFESFKDYMIKEEPLKVVFAPGCFDDFDGTQDELDDLISQIHKMVETGEIFEKSTKVDLDDMTDEDREIVESMLHFAENQDQPTNKKLH